MKTKYMILAGVIVNIVLSVILGRFMGITGIILRLPFARLSTYFWYEPKLLFTNILTAGQQDIISILKEYRSACLCDCCAVLCLFPAG